MDHLVEVNIVNNEVEKENYKTCPNGRIAKKKT
jgi:hypothetical protein